MQERRINWSQVCRIALVTLLLAMACGCGGGNGPSGTPVGPNKTSG